MSLTGIREIRTFEISILFNDQNYLHSVNVFIYIFSKHVFVNGMLSGGSQGRFNRIEELMVLKI